METTDLRTEFTKETKTRFNTEWLAYNDYVDWLEQRLVKLLTIPPVINCPNCGSNNTTSSGIKSYKHYCRECVVLKPKILCHPHIPMPLHGVAPRKIKGRVYYNIKPWFERLRNEKNN